jgi:hypothetical protein
VFSGNPEVTGQCEFESAAQGETVDGSYHGLCHFFDLAERFLSGSGEFFGFRGRGFWEHGYVGACAEGSVSVSCDDEAFDAGVFSGGVEHVGEFFHHDVVESVKSVCPVKNNPQSAFFTFDLEGFVGFAQVNFTLKDSYIV